MRLRQLFWAFLLVHVRPELPARLRPSRGTAIGLYRRRERRLLLARNGDGHVAYGL